MVLVRYNMLYLLSPGFFRFLVPSSLKGVSCIEGLTMGAFGVSLAGLLNETTKNNHAK